MSSTITRALVLVLALGASACGQTLTPRPATTPPSPPVATPAIKPPARFIFSAVGEDGAALPDLAQQDLDVRIGERMVAVRGLARLHEAPIRIVIVLDESSSMAASWTAALGIVSELLRSLTANSSVALIGVNSETPELIETPGAIARYLHNRSKRGPGGWTRLWDDIHLALLALPQPRPTDVIFVVSDGVDTASKLDFHRLREEVRASGVRVSGAILVDILDPTATTRIVSPDLLDLMNETGGWNLTSSPFVHRHVEAVRFEEKRTQEPNLAGFFNTLYDFYFVELGAEAKVARPEPLTVHIAGARNIHERIFVSAPERMQPATP